MKKGLLATLGIFLSLTLAACSNETASNNTQSSESIKELVHKYSTGSFSGVSASITSHELIVTSNNGKKTSYALPEKDFFVSIAPYMDQTHPCAIHSLTGCRGELAGKEFNVLIQDEEGNVVVHETMTSMANGFLDLWLPRNKTYQVKIEYDGKIAQSKISTFEGDNTCVTTMQLV